MKDLAAHGLILVALAVALAACTRAPRAPVAQAPAMDQVIAIHLLSWTSDSLLVELGKVVPALASKGVNLIFLEVDYSFDFQSHPELRSGGNRITRDGARRFARICREHGIRLVPEFQSLGHQSWAAHTGPLLTMYPELDLTPGAFPDNEGIYCREWDPTNPRVNEIVFPLIDEIVDAFEADGIHVGMDEIFLLDSEHAPNTRDRDPAAVFAQVVNEFHAHFVQERGLEMFMWGDRLIDGEVYGYGSYESSHNGTAPAVDMIPTDIVICDWHYLPMRAYGSIPMFLDKGFRVLPSSWRDPDGVAALIKYSYGLGRSGMLGHLFTTWRRLEPADLLSYAPLNGVETIAGGRFFDVAIDLQSVSSDGRLEVALATSGRGLDIFYTTDGSTPDRGSARYSQPVHLDRSALLQAIAYRGETLAADVTQQRFTVHAATGRSVTLSEPPSPKYPPANGAATLVNGVSGSSSYADGQWVGAEGNDLEALIDLGAPARVSRVTVTSLNNRPNWVHHADHVEVSGSSDGAHFEPLGEVEDVVSDEIIVPVTVELDAATTRYLRVVVRNRLIPEGYSGAGEPAWVFVDEIVVD